MGDRPFFYGNHGYFKNSRGKPPIFDGRDNVCVYLFLTTFFLISARKEYVPDFIKIYDFWPVFLISEPLWKL